jgi:pilus assembly protein CpaE
MLNVTVVGATDRQLDDLLRAAGMRTAATGLDGLSVLSRPAAAQPDVLVVDVRGGKGVPTELAVIRRQHPATGVVIATAALDPALLLEAMRAGVNEVVTEPLTQENLTAAIARVARQRGGAEPGQSFAFIGAKGGVGTTTVAVNVAASLGAVVPKGERVLLIDLHQGGGDAGVFVGAEARFSVQDALENTHRLDDTFLRTLVVPAAPNVDLLAAPEGGIGQIESSRIRTLIGAAAAAYRYTVLDVPGSNGAVLDSLDHVSKIILVANQELATVKGASRMAAALHRRYGRDKVEVVLSRSDRQADIGHTDVERAVGAPIAFTFPSDYRAALQALNKGRPLALDNHNDLSDAFKRFAHSLAGVRAERPAATARTGLFGRRTQVRD